jgi:hypothetical protein
MLIGLYGMEGSGRRTLANQLVLHDVYERYLFAGPVHNMLRQFHIPDDIWDDPVRSSEAIPWLGFSPDELKNSLLNGWGRNLVTSRIWVVMAKGRWHHINAGRKGRVVIPDLTQRMEAEWIKNEGGINVRIKSPFDKGKIMVRTVPDNLISFEINNDSTPSKLRERFWEQMLVEIG